MRRCVVHPAARALAEVSAAVIALAALVGCTAVESTAGDGGPGAASDATVADPGRSVFGDSWVQHGRLDAGGDVEPTPDATVVAPHDAALPDAGAAEDAGPDASPDGRPEADASPDAGSSGPGDAAATDAGRDPVDASADVQQYDVPPLQDFPAAVTAAACERIRTCCQVSVAAWDQKFCVDLFAASRGWQEVARFSAYLKVDGGAAPTVKYDQAKADECLRRTSQFTCGTLQGVEERAIREACGKAIQGTIPVGQSGCRAAVDCADGYCGAYSGGVGTCMPLRSLGQSCAPSDPTDPIGDLACSRFGLGLAPAAFCERQDGGGSACAAGLGTDVTCKGFQQCASGQCDPEPPFGRGVCVNEAVVSDPGVPGGFCEMLTVAVPDGG